MGLDVYLVEKEREARDKEREQAWEALFARKESGEIDEAEYTRLSDELPAYELPPETSSEKYPEHLFNRRYLRSSYNDSGFNRAVPEFVGDPNADLYWVFEPVMNGDEEYLIELTPDHLAGLREAKKRASALAERLREAETPLRVWTIPAYNSFAGPESTTSDEALAWYREQMQKETSFEGGWSNKQGTFVGKPGNGLDALAFVRGQDVLGTPCLHVVFTAGEEAVEHYAESAEIVAEFCDEATMLVERDGQAFIHWSS